MFSSVCQGLELCLLETRAVESHFLRLKQAPTTANFPGTIAINLAPNEPESMSDNEEKNTSITNDNNTTNDCKLMDHQITDMGGWSFLQSLASPKDSTELNKIYVHPLVKHSASTLSEKSLELCTESLGCETGSEISDRSDYIPFLSSETVGCNPSKPRENLVTRRMSRSSSFPPPLTSISSSNGVQVKSHREGGRLVLQAVTIPSCNTYFHAERSEGRLRLCLLKDTTHSTPIFEDKDSEDDEEEEEEEPEVVVEDEEGEVVHEENGDVEDEVEEEKCHRGDEDMEGMSGNVGGEIGKGKLARPSSCKESTCGRKGLLDWEPFLVAT